MLLRIVFVIILLLIGGFSVSAAETGPAGAAQNSYRIWLRTFGNWYQGEAESSDMLKFSSYGAALGIDKQYGKHWLFGIALGKNNTSLKWSPLPEKSSVSGMHADFFARRTFEQFYIDAEGNFGFNRHSHQDDATQWTVSGETGTWWTHGLGKAEPFVRLSHVCWNGTGNKTKETLTAGVRYSWRTSTDLTRTVPRIYGGLIQELGGRSLVPVSSFGNTPTVFFQSPLGKSPLEIPASRLFLGGGFTTSMGTSLDISFRYTAEMSSRDTSHAILLGINCNF